MVQTKQLSTTRANAPITFFRGATGKNPFKHGTFADLLEMINQEDPTKAKMLRELKQKNPDEFTKQKRWLSTFASGKFSYASGEGLEVFSPLQFYDWDGLSSDLIPFILDECKQEQYIHIAFPSPSGEGLRIGVWTDATEHTHKDVYHAVCKHLSDFFEIPLAKPKDNKGTGFIDHTTSNISRAWFFTYVRPEDFYFNPESKTFKAGQLEGGDPPSPRTVKRPESATNGKYKVEFSHLDKVENLISTIERSQLDITQGSVKWFRIGCTLFAEFGEEGRSLFHRVSRFHRDYSEKACNIEFDNCKAKQQIGRIRINSFYGICQDHGVLVDYEALKALRRQPAAEKAAPRPPSAEKEASEDPIKERPKIVRMRDLLAKRYDFRLNTVSNDVELSQKGKNQFETLNENNILVELMVAGFSGVEAPLMALLKSDFVPKLDPFTAYFENLPAWKPGDPDYIEHLANFVDAREQQWFNVQFKKMMVRTVACAIGWLPFNKHCFTLKSNQNDGKSYFLRFLVPSPLKPYTTDHFDPNNKDGLFALCQNFIINLDELSTFSKADVRRIKAIFTLEAVKERLPYDRRPSFHKRRASFLASTNDDEFLTDETGNVRWLVFEIHGVNHDNGGEKGYEANVKIDVVWAQAYALLKQGFSYQLSREEIQQSERNNRGYQITTLEMEYIQDSFKPGKKDDKGAEFMTAGDIAEEISPKFKGSLSYINIGRAMKILGFEKSQKHDHKSGFQRKGYWVIRNPQKEEPPLPF